MCQILDKWKNSCAIYNKATAHHSLEYALAYLYWHYTYVGYIRLFTIIVITLEIIMVTKLNFPITRE